MLPAPVKKKRLLIIPGVSCCHNRGEEQILSSMRYVCMRGYETSIMTYFESEVPPDKS